MKYYSYPLLCTRGAIIFPMQDLSVEVGRLASINAVNYAKSNNSSIVIVSQKDLTVDFPKPEDLYEYGTICHIKEIREREDHLKVIFTGMCRCLIKKQYISNEVDFVEVEELLDVYTNEEVIQIIENYF